MTNCVSAGIQLPSIDSPIPMVLGRVPGTSTGVDDELVVVTARGDATGVAALLGLAARGGVPLSRREPDFSAPGAATRRPLAHSNLSRSPIVLSRGARDGAVHLDPHGSRTRVEVDGVPVENGRTCTAEDLERGVVLRLGSHIVLLLHRLDPLDPMKPLDPRDPDADDGVVLLVAVAAVAAVAAAGVQPHALGLHAHGRDGAQGSHGDRRVGTLNERNVFENIKSFLDAK